MTIAFFDFLDSLISEIEDVSVNKVLSVLVNTDRIITPEQQHYDDLEVDEFWTYRGNKKNKVWLIYAYHRATGEIVSYVFEERNCKQPENYVINYNQWASDTIQFAPTNGTVLLLFFKEII